MNFAKRLLMGAGLIGLAMILGVALTPKAAHALVATLVQVVNTSANAVPTQAVVLEPFSWEAIVRGPTNTVLFAPPFTVPLTTADGKTITRLVIEGVSSQCEGLSATGNGIRVVDSNGVESFFPFLSGPDPSSPVLGAPARIYVTAGSQFSMNLLGFENSGVCAFSATGHYETQ